MVQRLAPLLEVAEESSTEAFPEYEDSQQSRGNCYLDMIRSILIPADKVSLRSSTGSSSDGSISSMRSSGMSLRTTNSRMTKWEHEALAVRELAFRMVRDGVTQALIVEFGRNPNVLERWFSELDIHKALRVHQHSDGHQVPSSVWKWTRALTLMTEALIATQQHLRGERSTADGCGRDGEAVVKILISDANTVLEDGLEAPLNLSRFVVASMLKMLGFADALAAMELEFSCPIAEKLRMLLNLHTCISEASETVLPPLIEESHRLVAWREIRGSITMEEESRWLSASREMRSLVHRMESDFSTRKDKLAEAIWSMMQNTKVRISSKDSWVPMTHNGEVHKTTKSILEYVNVLWANDRVLSSIVWRFSESWYHTTTTNMIADSICDLEHQLEEESNSLLLLNPSLRYIFLLNNIDFIKEELNKFQFHSPHGFDRKLEKYLKCYLDVSWEPVVSCLISVKSSTSRLFPNNCLPLEKFQSKLKATCDTEKFWKVPNPNLRKRLREAIIGKVIGAYKDYMQDYQEQQKRCGDLPNFISSHDLEEMLSELFEG